MSWPIVLDAVEQMDMTLLSDLSWAGGRFPFAGSQDITINANTTWSDAAGFRKVKKLTIAAGVTLRIIRTPFFIFADEIAFGSATSKIDISGFNGDETNPLANFARGGRVGGQAFGGGDGGGLLIICVGRFTGAAGQILANGGNHVAGSTYSVPGSGALSKSAGNSTQAWTQQNWSGTASIGASTATTGYLHQLAYAMANGGGGSPGYGGGGGAIGGGSGIGGGGGTGSPGTGGSFVGFTPMDLIRLALNGCAGGGGGATSNQSANFGGGGGGGGIGLWYKSASQVPVMTANGGLGANPAYNNDGGAGVTFAIQV